MNPQLTQPSWFSCNAEFFEARAESIVHRSLWQSMGFNPGLNRSKSESEW